MIKKWKIVKIPHELERVFLDNTNFVSLCSPEHYPYKIMKGEIGFLGNIRVIIERTKENKEGNRKELAMLLREACLPFAPYYEYQNKNTPKNEVGRVFGCRVIL